MQPKTAAEKELLKENLYQNRVREILTKHKGTLQAAYNGEAGNDDGEQDPSIRKKQYAAEGKIIERVMSNERNAFLSGIALFPIVFASVRFGPRFLAVKINPEKARKLREADEIAEKAGTRWIQKTAALVFEVSFGAWAGWRGYNIVSSQNTSSYEEISKIPLVAGRSSVYENVCSDWVNLVHSEIPAPFWKHLDDIDDSERRRLKDPNRWRSVRDFADNCVKRMVYENAYRKQHGLKSDEVVVVPKGGVPGNVLLSTSSKK